MNLVLIAPSDLPIPAVKGGAIETGIQQIIDENEKQHKVNIKVYSYYNREAEVISKKYKYTTFVYYKQKKVDNLIKFIIKVINHVFKKAKLKIRFNIHYHYLKFIIKELKEMKDIKNTTILIKNAVNFVIPIKKRTGTKVFLQLHNDFLNKDTYKAEKIVENCEALISNSEYIKKCISTIANASKKKIMVNKNCLDDSDFEEITEEEVRSKALEYGIDVNKTNILFSGRIVPEKGIKELLYAIQDISKEIDWNLNIVGSKCFGKTKVDKFTKELYDISDKNKDKIKFMGYVKHSDMRFINKIADVSVIPSIWEEPAGRVALESQVVGTPIIISDSGGIKEYTNLKASIVVKRGENFVQDLTKALNKILLNENLKKNMGEEARKVTQPYTTTHYYNEILEQLNLG